MADHNNSNNPTVLFVWETNGNYWVTDKSELTSIQNCYWWHVQMTIIHQMLLVVMISSQQKNKNKLMFFLDETRVKYTPMFTLVCNIKPNVDWLYYK